MRTGGIPNPFSNGREVIGIDIPDGETLVKNDIVRKNKSLIERYPVLSGCTIGLFIGVIVGMIALYMLSK